MTSWKSGALLSAAFALCAAGSVAAANVVPDNPTFAKDILPILERSCQS